MKRTELSEKTYLLMFASFVVKYVAVQTHTDQIKYTDIAIKEFRKRYSLIQVYLKAEMNEVNILAEFISLKGLSEEYRI